MNKILGLGLKFTFVIGVSLCLYSLFEKTNYNEWFSICLCFCTAHCIEYTVGKLINMKKYKHYFKKTDTPYRQEYQKRKKYHTVWMRTKYKRFLGHRVYKIKLFGIFTIYKDEGVDYSEEKRND